MEYIDITVSNIHALKKQWKLDTARETNPESPKIVLKYVSKTFGKKTQYLFEYADVIGCVSAPLHNQFMIWYQL